MKKHSPGIGFVEVGAILLDASGTLLNDFPAFYPALFNTFRKYNLPPPTHAELRREFKLPYSNYLVEKGFTDVEGAVKEWKKVYEQNENLIELFGDVKTSLTALSSIESLKLGIVSQTPKESLDKELVRLGIKDYFDRDNIIYDMWKPNPEGLFLALDNLQISRFTDVIFVGDMKEDMIAARRANALKDNRYSVTFHPVGINRSYGGYHDLETLREGRPEYIIHSLNELVEFVKSPENVSDLIESLLVRPSS